MSHTGTSYDFSTMAVECKACGETTLHKVSHLENSQTVDCKVCRAPIDVSSPEWRERIDREAFVSKQIVKL